ncbi:YihY/virulence factor BrkB family protein [Aeromicrobium phragmitis]|uniref:YihY/virulence factor BrkB family protein n=1 Tax=Aeromicrobium phragmitis TaxID=2478914 RepID=A0A3L8PK26_9ACTN|nr:YihY/virulence factor BrkB family protein [Aeromicrobium phragmitis]RLV55063.1 YihY/virulence factor BrkB family protein [Aeromicrobium phragmitis]
MSAIDAIDRFQRRHPVVGFPLAVIYKFFDDQGPYLAAIITYYAFIAIFPLMLIATSVLGFFLQDDPQLQEDLLDTALAQFPIVGDQLGRPDGLTGSASAIVIGAIAATFGASGLGVAVQNAANVAWAVPRNSRPNPVLLRVRSLIIMGIAGLGVLAVAIGTSLLQQPEAIGLPSLPQVGWVVRVVGLVITALIFVTVFRLISLGRATWRSVLPGAIVCAVAWQLLQFIGDAYVRNIIGRTTAMNQTFALVLGLFAFLFIAALIVVVGLEVNVVLRRRMYPRALLTPFTDSVELGPGDIRAYTSYARMQRHKGFEKIQVAFRPPERDEPH